MRLLVLLSCLVMLLTPSEARAGGVPSGTCELTRLDGIRTVIARAVRAADERPAAHADIDREWHAAIRAVGAILGAEPVAETEQGLREQLRSISAGARVTLACDAGAPARDRLAYKLSLLGYSLDDIARVTSGGATKAAVDRDGQRRAVGLPPVPLVSRASTDGVEPMPTPDDGLRVESLRPVWTAAGVLDGAGDAARMVLAVTLNAQSRAPAPGIQRAVLRLVEPLPPPLRSMTPPSPAVIDWWTRYYALSYGVDYRLVAAVIRQESNGQNDSVSRSGALGLMQLMPSTAAMLRVNPRDPIDNLRGGIAYLAGLLSSYRNVRTALIAYNAGPAHADSVVRGERQPYPETQRYLQAVDALYPIDHHR